MVGLMFFDDDDDEFADAGTLQQIPNRGIRFVDIGDKEILLYREDNTIVAMSGNCTHAFASLRDGTVEDGIITCKRHGAKFDLKTGKSLSSMCPSLPRYQVQMSGNRVQIKKD
jgi:nitrite reductase/ring-hydroxylating ferredoxin subunit